MGNDVYLTSNDDVTKNPEWIKGSKPDANGKTNNAITAAVIVNDKGNGNVDAFYMYVPSLSQLHVNRFLTSSPTTGTSTPTTTAAKSSAGTS
jgi:hypothetical protein